MTAPNRKPKSTSINIRRDHAADVMEAIVKQLESRRLPLPLFFSCLALVKEALGIGVLFSVPSETLVAAMKIVNQTEEVA
jgi:hypothetical protein